MNKLVYFISLFLIFVLISCNEKPKTITTNSIEPKEINYKYCKNAIKLITSSDSSHIINIDFTQSVDSNIVVITNSYNTDICDSIIHYSVPFDLETNKFEQTQNSILLRIRLHNICSCYCEDEVSVRYVLFDINKQNQILFNSNVIYSDSIVEIIPNKYLYADKPLIEHSKSSFISLLWSKDVNKDSVSVVTSKVIDGYIETAKIYSKETYNKELCNLNSEELKLLKENLAFEFELITIFFGYPPPPEPVLVNE